MTFVEAPSSKIEIVTVAGEVNAIEFVAESAGRLLFLAATSTGELHLLSTEATGAALTVESSLQVGDHPLIGVEVLQRPGMSPRAVAIGISSVVAIAKIDIEAGTLASVGELRTASDDNRCIASLQQPGLVAIGGQRGNLCIADAFSCAKVAELKTAHTSTTRTIVQHNEWMVSAGQDRRISYWKLDFGHGDPEIVEGKTIENAHSGWIWQLAVHPSDGSLLSVSSDSRVGRYDLEGDTFTHVSEVPGAWLMSVLPLPDNGGAPLIVVGGGSGLITCLDGATYEVIVTVAPHNDEINDLAADPLGAVVLSVSRDGSVAAFPRSFFQYEERSRGTGSTHWASDLPTSRDLLGRERIATFLRGKMVEFLSDDAQPGHRAFLISGPWGAGKSSLVRLMLRHASDEAPNPVVAEVNAWSTLGRGISWTEVVEALTSSYLREARKTSIRSWLRLRLRILLLLSKVAISTVLVGAVVLGLVIIVGGLVLSTQNSETWTAIGAVLAGLVPITAAVTASSTLQRFRSSSTYTRSRWDTHQARDTVLMAASIINLCLEIVERPFVIVIDDLDRCTPEAVTDALESLHCVFESPAVGYHRNGMLIVAADEMWLRGSFEKIYGEMTVQDFGGGSSVGSRFLEKIFFLVLPTGRIAPEAETGFLRSLVSSEDDQTEGGAAHIIYAFRELLPDNPRTVRRVVAAFEGLRELKAAEGQPVPSATLMLWCILRTRWPDGAIALAANPEATIDTTGLNEAFSRWIGLPEVRRVLTWPVGGPLLPGDIRRCSSDV